MNFVFLNDKIAIIAIQIISFVIFFADMILLNLTVFAGKKMYFI